MHMGMRVRHPSIGSSGLMKGYMSRLVQYCPAIRGINRVVLEVVLAPRSSEQLPSPLHHTYNLSLFQPLIMATEPHHLGEEESRDEALSRIKSYGTLTMSPELFEKLYLQPLGNVKGDLRKTLANPTPLGLIGFSVALTPLACCLMGWRGSGKLGAANMYAVVLLPHKT
jgi:hypothetical protein